MIKGQRTRESGASQKGRPLPSVSSPIPLAIHCLLLLLSHFSRVRLFVTPVDYSPPGSSVPGILQARTPEWVAISFSKYTTGGFSQQARTWAQQKGARPALAPDIDGLPAGNSQVPTPAVAEQSTSGRAI